MATHNELGKKGEKLAIEYLLKNNYKIIETNYRFQKAEVDIIAQKEAILVALEVKTRSTLYFGKPEEFVNKKKIQLVVNAIDNYIIEHNLEVEVRFDIISIIKQKNTFQIKHLKDAFFYF